MSAGAAGAVAAWRRRLLDRAGYPPSLAGELAGDERFDVAALVALAERGCPPPSRVGSWHRSTRRPHHPGRRGRDRAAAHRDRGGGLAGAKAAETLREQGFDGA